MSVSDQSGGFKPIHGRNWPAIRRDYESSGLSVRKFSIQSKIPFGTLRHRIRLESWAQRARLVRKAAIKLDTQITEQIQADIRDELAPYIEAEKRIIIKRGVQIASRGMDRVDRMLDDESELDPKSEQFLAKSAQTYVQIGRTSLGMNDGTPTGGAISLNILTNQAAVQVVGPT